jgi:NAD+ synthase (glutamine-hydrolysing)
MIAAGMPATTVDEVIRLVDRSEYKRRQAAPGIRITPRAFGKDRRLPITNRFGG